MFNHEEIVTGMWGKDSSKKRLYIGVASSGKPEAEFEESLRRLQAYLLTETDLAVFIKFHNTSMLVTNRANAVNEAVDSLSDYTLFIDDDMWFKPSVFKILFSKINVYPIIGCNYPTRGFPHFFTARHRDRGDRVLTHLLSKGEQEVDFIGFGFVLFRTEVLKDLTKPLFRMEEAYGEDVFFFDKVYEEKNIRPTISHDASKLIGHITKRIITYTEGRANDRKNMIIRDPSMEEAFGELGDLDIYDDLPNGINLE